MRQGFLVVTLALLASSLLFGPPARAMAFLGGGSSPAVVVATTGNDGNPCTLAAPCLTPARAQTVARSLLAAGYVDVTVTFRGGTYPMTTALALGAADSGTAGHPVIWQSYPAETAAWDGGLQITGWTLHDAGTNTWQASVPPGMDFREFYVDGAHRDPAKAMLGGSYTLTGTGLTAPNTLLAGDNIPDIEFVIAPAFSWQAHRCKAASMSGTAITMRPECWNVFTGYNATLPGCPCVPTWAERSYTLLQHDDFSVNNVGAWYLDTATDTVYYRPKGGENMATVTVTVPKLQDFITDSGVSNITFSRLTFQYATWLGPNTAGVGYVDQWAGYFCTALPCGNAQGNPSDKAGTPIHSPITLAVGCSNVTFTHNLFTHIAGRALAFSHGCQNASVLANLFQDNGGSAMRWGDRTDGAETNPALQTSGLLFRNNLVADGPFEYLGSGGVTPVISTGSVIDHNEIDLNPGTSISVGWGWASGMATYNANNTVSNNKVSGFCSYFFDCGGIYTNNVNTGFSASGDYVVNTSGSFQTCLYPDEGSTFPSFTGEVCDPGGNRWLYIWTSSINHVTATGNYFASTSSGLLDNGVSDTISGNTSYTHGSPPGPAATIIANAGIQGGVTPGP